MKAEKLISLARNVSEIISSPSELEKALEETVHLFRTVLDAKSCSIMLLDAEGECLQMVAASDIAREKWPKISAKVGEGFAGKVAKTGRPLLVREARSNAHLDEERRQRYTSRSFICAPMRVKGDTIGVINITNREGTDPFTREQLDMVASLANLVALAIDNARLLASTEDISSRLHDVLEGIGDGVIAVDAEGSVLHHNELALHYLGLDSGLCVGRRLNEVMPEPLRSKFESLRERTLAERRHLHEDVEWKVQRSSTPVPLTISTTPLYRDRRGRLGGVVFVIHDMTLHHKVDELKRIDEAKNSFLAIVSHELRTPLTAIKGATHLLHQRLTTSLDSENLQLLRIVEKNAERLLQQIVNLLDVVNIENRTASLTLRRLRLSEVAGRCVGRARESAEQRGVAIVEDYSKDPEPILVDEEKITRAVGHLVDNAIKFTPRSGEIRVRTDRKDGESFVAIWNSGRGIDPALKEQIFDKFVQGEEHMTRQAGGCGIGLFVARAFAELHGGRIELGTVGDGCEFRLVVPVVSMEGEYAREEIGEISPPKAVNS